jgi:phosphatidylglycerophosphate synthase
MFIPLPAVFMDSKIWLSLLIFTGTCMPSFIRAYADHKGAIPKEKALALGGIFERSERLLLILLGLGAGLALSMEYFVYAVIVAIALSAITVLQRLFAVAKGA